MAASGKRAGKTNVFWSKDPNDQDDKILKLHMPGMLLEPHTNVKMPMVRKPVHMIKPRVVTLQKSSHNSLEKKCFPLKTSSSYTNQKRDSNDSNSASYQRQLILGERPKREQGRNTKEFTLKELNPQDKKRVANLVKELAKVGEERVYAEEKLQEERMAFEERLAILQEEYDAVIKEKHHLQKRFVELQELLVKYQSNGRTPSPKKPVKSVAYEQKEIHQISGDVSSIPPSAPSNSLPSKPELTEIPGNTRPNTSSTETVSEKLSSKSQLPLPVIAPQARIDSAPHEKSEPLHQLSSFPLSQPRESVRGKSSLSPQAKQIAEGVLGGCPPVATHTNGKETSQSRDQTVIIPHTTPGDVPALNSSNLRETSLNTSSSVTGGYHVPSSIPQSQPAVQHGPTVMSQYPTHEKHVFSVFGGSEPRIPPRKNEDRSFSEASGVSGNFSAELDAVYRLYCREYELQLQLQQQQIELQKQQLQLQQQLQQVETLQQQQQQQQQEQQQQQQPPSSVKSPKHVLTAGQALTGRMNQPITVVEETPAPSPLPRPASQPRQVSPARSLIPTPEGSSSILSNGRFLPGADVQGSRAESSVGTFVSCAPSEAEMSRGRASNRVDLGKENRDPVVPDPHERVMSAPPSLPHSRQILEHYQEPRYQHEFIVPSTHSNYVRYSRKDNTQASSQRMNGTLDVVYHNDGLLSSRSSCHSNHTDASLRERKDEDFYVVPNLFSGRASSNLFHPNVDQESAVERGESIAERLQTDEGSNTQLAFLEPHSANPYRPTGSLNREISDSDQRFSLYSEVHSRYGRIPLDSGYPLSVVDIVDGLEGEKHIAPCGNAVVADGLDTSDSGYSQDTYKGTSPLTSDTVNTDEEEAAVLEDIFFLKGRM